MRTTLRFVTALSCLALLFTTAFADSLDEARELIDEGRHQDAVDRLEKAGASLEREILLSQAFVELGRHSEAIRSAKAATKRAPKSAEAHLAHAVAMRSKMLGGSRVSAMMAIGGYKKALRRALELAPDNVDVREEEIGYLLMAPGIAGGDKERALERARELRVLDPERGRLNEISALLTLERDDEGFALMREHLAENPAQEAVRWRLATLLQGRQRYAEADAEFEMLLTEAERDDLRVGALYQLGRSRVLGEYELDRAVELFERYIGEAHEVGVERPSPASAHWRMGMAHEAAGRKAEARTDYERALTLEGDHEQARKSLAALKKKR